MDSGRQGDVSYGGCSFHDRIGLPRSGRNQESAMAETINALQWPAMAATLIAAWLVASQTRVRRNWGFWCFIASNALWIVWGWHDQAYALIAMQVGLFVLNVRGTRKNDPEHAPERPESR